MASLIPGLPGKANDLLVKDTAAVHISDVLARNGWGAKNTDLNGRARAVIKRESGGDPKAYNKSGATGWFQMMTPLHCGSYGIPAQMPNCRTWLEDPDNNSASAHALFNVAGWSPWKTSGPSPPAPTTWDPVVQGSSSKGTLTDTVANAAGDVASAVTSPATSVFSAVTDLIGTLLSPDTWFRIGKTWLGFVLINIGVVAFVYIVANNASGGQVQRTAKTAATAAAAVTKGVVK